MPWSLSTPERIERQIARALTHIEVLASNIGPRPAGSPAERQALDYLSGLLSEWGYKVQREAVAFAPLPAINLPYLLGAIALGTAGWVSRSFPWLALALPFLFMILPQGSRWWLQQRKPMHFSENLLAWLGKDTLDTPPALLFCAHIDTARALPLKNPRLLRLYSRTLDILQRFAWMIFALALLQTWGWEVANGLLYAVAALGSLGGLWLAGLQFLPTPKDELGYSPGANDNASGVAVVLALAEELSDLGELAGSIAFLFTTAEESGLYGARDFIKNHPEWAKTSAVVCVDMVGSGEMLYYVAKEGVLNPLHTSSKLQQALQEVNASLQPLWHTLRSGDYAPFCQAGFQAISLEAGGKSLTDWSYHSVFDTRDRINPQMLRQVLQTLFAFCEKYQEPRPPRIEKHTKGKQGIF